MNVRNPVRSVWKLCLGVVAVVVLSGSATARACTTPVYRYAMYNWPPGPYYVFYLYDGHPSKEDQQVNDLIAQLGEAMPAAANVILEPVDVSQQQQLDRLPGVVKDAWKSHEDVGLPMHLLFTAWGVELFGGRLEPASVQSMVQSPIRTRLGQLLDGGHITVLILVSGSDEAENGRAEEAAKELIARAAAGAIPVESAFDVPPYAETPYAETPATPPEDDDTTGHPANDAGQIKVALLKVDRSDPAEQWLIRSLTAIEPDLVELAEQPMIFAAYGRGRALEPYVGKGITADNLEEVVMFLGSACSCLVKEQNPGADLLMQWDWDTTAEHLAASDPTLYGSPFGYQEFPTTDVDDEMPSEEPETVAEVSSATAASGPQADETPTDQTPSPQADPSPPADTPQTRQSSSMARETPVRQTGRSFASRQVWTYGIGLAVAAVLVLAAGFVLIRKQSGTEKG